MNGSQPQQDHLQAVDSLIDWLVDQGLGGQPLDAMFAECCSRLRGAGVPLLRGHIAFRTLHPLNEAGAVTWWRDRGSEGGHLPHRADGASAAWLRSPLYHVIERRLPSLRRRLTGPEARLDFPVLEDLCAAGAIDYLAFLLVFDEAMENGIVGSWASDRSRGFDAGDLAILDRVQRHLAVACRARIQDDISRNLVEAYLGPRAAAQVLSGQIRRGDGRRLRAALWYCDLRGSTGLAQSLPVDVLLAVLNDYLDCAVGAVRDFGGEVVTMIGDALLAIFPSDEAGGDAAACAAALAAARAAHVRLAQVNAAGLPDAPATLTFGVGLHLGEVVFGNIGSPDRLQFTVIGEAVNQVVRIEALSKELARPVLASGPLAAQLPEDWQPLGRRELRGLRGTHEILAPPVDPG